MFRRTFLPILIIFIAVLLFTFLFKDRLTAWKVDATMIHGGNLLLFIVTLFTWLFRKKAMDAGNSKAFLRNVYGGMSLKMFACLIAFFLYVSFASHVNKPAVFTVVFLYFVYTFTEIVVFLKYSKNA